MKKTRQRAPARKRQIELRVWDAELVVDNFAGGGGASCGIEAAIGRPCDLAVNHDADAIAMHKANHPGTKHLCEDIWEVDPREACGGKPVGLAWFSPDCTHFSRAAGTRPLKKEIRGLAWIVIRWAKAVAPRVIVLENVPEFEDWGPIHELKLGKDGNPIGRCHRTGCDAKLDGRPCAAVAGETFKRWLRHLKSLGYSVEWRHLSAAEYGAPTTRTRLFLIARSDGRPIVWPTPTHAKEATLDGLSPYRTAAEIIDWSEPIPSIFDPKRRKLAENTLRRIADGIKRYVIECAEPFILRTGHYSNKSGQGRYFRGQTLRAPLGTVCATNDKNLVVPWVRPKGRKGKGTAKLVASFLAKHYGGVVGHGLERPIGTVTAKDHHSVVGAFLTRYNGTGRARPLTKPIGAVTARDRFNLGAVVLDGESYEIVDIGMRMLTPRELFNAQGFPTDYVIATEVGGKPLTKTAQIAMAGNSVCPPMAEAIVRANYESERWEEEPARAA